MIEGLVNGLVTPPSRYGFSSDQFSDDSDLEEQIFVSVSLRDANNDTAIGKKLIRLKDGGPEHTLEYILVWAKSLVQSCTEVSFQIKPSKPTVFCALQPHDLIWTHVIHGELQKKVILSNPDVICYYMKANAHISPADQNT